MGARASLPLGPPPCLSVTTPVLPHHVTCYKAFYQDKDGLLHTLYGNRSVATGERLTCLGDNEPIMLYTRGIHFCVAPESCMDVYTSEHVNDWVRVVAVVTPELSDCMFDGLFTYCTRSVVVERVMTCADAISAADVYAEAKLARVPPDADNYLVLNWAARVGNCRAVNGIIRALTAFPRGWNHQARTLAFRYGQHDVEWLLADPTRPWCVAVRGALQRFAGLYGCSTLVTLTERGTLLTIGGAVILCMLI